MDDFICLAMASHYTEEPITNNRQFRQPTTNQAKVHIRIVPSIDNPSRSLIFNIIERDLEAGHVIKIGRFTDKSSLKNHISFKSKVVSRSHCEIWLNNDGKASVLSYGKLNLHNTKKPKTSWAHYLSTLTVPKHYFNHFYVVGLSFGILCAVELYFKDGILFYILRQLDQPSQSDRLSQMQCRIGLLLINVHLARRVYESFRIERPSKEAMMHISHYLVGIGFYGAMVFGTWLEGASYLGVWPTAPIEKGCIDWTTFIAISLFLYASIHQYRCHCILASLRYLSTTKYSVPKGDWFEWIVAPHYFADILIYVSLCILYRFQNMIILFGLVWTVVNLSITANQTFLWYQKQFPQHPELKKRWRIIPGIY
ncbi:hypothetical protein G6F25_004761 [Rhizopus arrhizus]|nr:hypothetical protein G6F25_004761 [Rhizopus arrhizus]